ncbi:GNAT family N-acetyltransferase [Undibacterium rugosum]|uniref:GNAT family N-acetyltransferase n=1 Tax=Undibacterium rugosum TaxID=2762291 RepID=UPI0039B04ECC
MISTRHTGGQGIVASAARALLAWAYSEMGWVRIQATVLPSNLASIRVLEKLSFEREGLLRSFRQVRGVAGDFLMYSRITQDAG